MTGPHGFLRAGDPDVEAERAVSRVFDVVARLHPPEIPVTYWADLSDETRAALVSGCMSSVTLLATAVQAAHRATEARQ